MCVNDLTKPTPDRQLKNTHYIFQKKKITKFIIKLSARKPMDMFRWQAKPRFESHTERRRQHEIWIKMKQMQLIGLMLLLITEPRIYQRLSMEFVKYIFLCDWKSLWNRIMGPIAAWWQIDSVIIAHQCHNTTIGSSRNSAFNIIHQGELFGKQRKLFIGGIFNSNSLWQLVWLGIEIIGQWKTDRITIDLLQQHVIVRPLRWQIW